MKNPQPRTLREALTIANGGVERGAARACAKRLRKSDVVVNEWCRGVKVPGEQARAELARYLGLSVEQVLALLPTGSRARAAGGSWDQYAAAALGGILAKEGRGDVEEQCDAAKAYADAMTRRR